MLYYTILYSSTIPNPYLISFFLFFFFPVQRISKKKSHNAVSQTIGRSRRSRSSSSSSQSYHDVSDSSNNSLGVSFFFPLSQKKKKRKERVKRGGIYSVYMMWHGNT
jgi:hypothetical protein